MRLAYLSPLSPLKSGISEYSERELLPYLSQHCKIDIIIDKDYEPVNQSIKENFEIIKIEKFENSYDKILYHVGNNPFHKYIYETAIKYPGIVVMHDPLIHHLIRFLTVGEKKPEKYIQLMEFAYGPKGRVIAEDAIVSRNFPLFEYPLVKELVESSFGTIVHSEFAEKIIREECPDAIIKKINMPISLEKKQSSPNLRQKLNIPENHIVVGTFGNIGFYKRLNVALKAFSHYLKKNPQSIFVIVGTYLNDAYADEIHKLVEDLGIGDKVIETGFVENLQPYIDITDIAIQLRYPTAGETSIITLQIMGNKKPVIVSNIGSFKELPEESVIKIEPDVKEEVSLYNALLKLTNEKEWRQKISESAEEFIKEKHDPNKIALEIFEFVNSIQNKELKKLDLPETRILPNQSQMHKSELKESELKESELKGSLLKELHLQSHFKELQDDDANMLNSSLKNINSGNKLIRGLRKSLHNEIKDWIVHPFQKKQTIFNRKTIQNLKATQKEVRELDKNIKVNFNTIKKDSEVNFDRMKKDSEVNFDRMKKDSEVNFDIIKKELELIKNDINKNIQNQISQDEEIEKAIHFNLDRRIDNIIESKVSSLREIFEIENQVKEKYLKVLDRLPNDDELQLYVKKIKNNESNINELENELHNKQK